RPREVDRAGRAILPGEGAEVGEGEGAAEVQRAAGEVDRTRVGPTGGTDAEGAGGRAQRRLIGETGGGDGQCSPAGRHLQVAAGRVRQGARADRQGAGGVGADGAAVGEG